MTQPWATLRRAVLADPVRAARVEEMVRTMTDRTLPPPSAAPAAPGPVVRCRRCRQTLAIRGDAGQIWVRHHGLTVLVEGLTARQRVRLWCHKCAKENEIAA